MRQLDLSDKLLVELENLVARTPLAKERCRAQALLWLAEGETVKQIADLLHVSRGTVYNWTKRFRQREGLDLRARLLDAPRPGRTRILSNEDITLLEELMLQGATSHGWANEWWTGRRVAKIIERY